LNRFTMNRSMAAGCSSCRQIMNSVRARNYLTVSGYAQITILKALSQLL